MHGCCRLPSEVLHEARFLPDVDSLRALEYETTGAVLRQLQTIMASLPPGDFDLVDLYANLGNADPLLVACALDAMEEAESGLFGLDWTVVTNDHAVLSTAKEFGVTTLTSQAFAKFMIQPGSDV